MVRVTPTHTIRRACRHITAALQRPRERASEVIQTHTHRCCCCCWCCWVSHSFAHSYACLQCVEAANQRLLRAPRCKRARACQANGIERESSKRAKCPSSLILDGCALIAPVDVNNVVCMSDCFIYIYVAAAKSTSSPQPVNSRDRERERERASSTQNKTNAKSERCVPESTPCKDPLCSMSPPRMSMCLGGSV